MNANWKNRPGWWASRWIDGLGYSVDIQTSSVNGKRVTKRKSTNVFGSRYR